MEFEKLKNIIAKRFNVDVSSITRDTQFISDLGADSLQMLQLNIDICKEFDIELDSSVNSEILTVADAYNAVMALLV
ncbi:MAG: acyl carrier protein [Lachnospiraceae bacterium]|nr:acyl carrier protein [Lachnospiraceae bacterium]